MVLEWNMSVYLTAMWCILRPFGTYMIWAFSIFCDHFEDFLFRFGLLHHEKSGITIGKTITAMIASLPHQGLQIFLGTTYQNWEKMHQKDHECTEWPKNTKWCKIGQLAIKFIQIFYCKALQNLPKLGFLV
jgi:DMSO reductase anchor subunit